MKNFTSDFMFLKVCTEKIFLEKNIPTLQAKELEDFINGESTNCSREYFLLAHGNNPLRTRLKTIIQLKMKTLFQIISISSPTYYLEYFGAATPAHKLISKIIKNNSNANSTPVVHLLSCFSGAAHDALNKVSGDVILCTYSDPSKTNTSCLSNAFINLRTSKESLKTYILNNFLSCAAVNFSISVKIGDQISNYTLDSGLITAAEHFQKYKFQQLTRYLAEKLNKTHLENYTRVIPFDTTCVENKKTYTNIDMALLVCINNNDSIGTIRKFLNKKNLVHSAVVKSAILCSNIEVLKLLLEFTTNQVNKAHIHHVISGTLAAFKFFLGFPTNQVDKTIISYAICNKNLEALKLLLEVFPNQVDKTTMECAIRDKNLEALKLLLEVSPNQVDKTTITCAIYGKHLEALKILLEVSPNQVDTTTMECAIRDKNLEALKLLLEVSPNQVDTTTITCAIYDKNLEALKLLLEVSPNQVDTTTITCAIYDKNLEALKLLLEVSLNQVDRTTIECAIRNKNLEALKLLLEVSLNQVDRTTIECAIRNKNLEALKLLLEVFPNQVDRTTIECAICNKNLEALKLLLEVSPNQVDRTTIAYAVYDKNLEALKLLLEVEGTPAYTLDRAFYLAIKRDMPDDEFAHRMLDILEKHTAQLSLKLTQAMAGTEKSTDSVSIHANPNPTVSSLEPLGAVILSDPLS